MSVAEYGIIKHNEMTRINNILLADGCRVENHTKDLSHIGENWAGIINIIRYFGNKRLNYKIELLLVNNDTPLIEESKLLTCYIDFLVKPPITQTLNVIGLSKCGVMVFDMMKYLKNVSSKLKTNVYSVSTPYSIFYWYPFTFKNNYF